MVNKRIYIYIDVSQFTSITCYVYGLPSDPNPMTPMRLFMSGMLMTVDVSNIQEYSEGRSSNWQTNHLISSHVHIVSYEMYVT